MAKKIKDVFTSEDITKAYLAGTTYGAESVREAIRRSAADKPQQTEQEIMAGASAQIIALLESLGTEA